MTIRPISDAAAIRALHVRMGMPYPFPDLERPLFLSKLEAVDAHNRVVAACAVKVVGEAFVWCDRQWAAVAQARAIRALSADAAAAASAAGLEEVSAWIPPAIEPGFAPFLARIGWIKSPWATWTRLL